MRYENNDRLRQYLDRGAAGAYREHMRHPGFELDASAFSAALGEVREQHADLSDDEAEARAVFRLLTRGAPPEIAVALPSRWYRARAWTLRAAFLAWPWLKLAWAVAVLFFAALAAAELSAMRAHAAPPPDPDPAANVVSREAALHALLLRPPALIPQLAGGSLAARVQFLNGSSAWSNVSASNPLPMTCISGCGSGGSGGGTSSTDEGTFAQGTTSLTPIGGFYSTSITNLSSGQTGAVQMTSDRKLFVQDFQGTSPWVVSANGGSFAVTESGTWNVGQSGTWTLQPGNTANTTPWLFTLNQGGNSAAVTASNALKVDGSAVTQPVSGTFWQTTQPVSLASLPALATGSNTIGSVELTDGTHTAVVDPCAGQTKSFTPISQASASAKTLVAGTASKKTYICEINVVAGAAVDVGIVEGTGTNCSTISAGLFGGTTAATGWILAADGLVSLGNGASSVAATATAADNLCILDSGTAQVSGNVVTVQQ